MRVLILLAVLTPSLAAIAASPAVEAALALPRTKPAHFVETSLALANLGATEDADRIAEEFAKLKPSEEELTRLVQDVGTAALLQLATRFPQTSRLVEGAIAAADAEATSPERLSRLLEQLTTGDLAEQQRVLREFRRTGTAGVTFLIDAIATVDDSQSEARLREALVALDPESLPAIVAATASESPAVATQACYAVGRLAQLGRLQATLPVTLLLRPALTRDDAVGEAARWSYAQARGGLPSPAEAAALLDRSLELIDRNSLPLPISPEGTLAWPGAGEVPLDQAARVLAARLAADHAVLAPGDPASRRRAALLAAEAGELAPNAPPLDDFRGSELLTMLGAALKAGQHTAAELLCDTLGSRRDVSALLGAAGKPTPLAAALRSPSPAVRYAALSAIMQIEPNTPFPGSSGVAEALAYFVAGRGDRRAVVAAPTIAYASEVAGMLATAGYSTTPVNTGAELMELVSVSPDVELLLIDLAVLRPAIRETVFRLRRTPAGGELPIAIMASDGRLLEAQNLAAEHDSAVIAVSRVRGSDDAASLAERLTSLATTPSAEARRERAAQATNWLSQIAERGPRFFELRGSIPRLANVLPLSGKPLRTLANLGDAASQQRLAAAASESNRPIGERRAAADAFTQSVGTYGLLMTEEQVRRQYRRYNDSAAADADTQAVLGAVLDAIETRRPASRIAPTP
ncbi:MAG: hypothetical protein AAFV43_04695 [Planctomycetota bacterium]